MRALLLCVVAGCSYDPRVGAAGDDTPSDSSIEIDGPPDTMTFAACTIEPMGIDAPATPAFIGGTGGQNRDDARCAQGEVPIGLWFHVSNNGIADHDNQVAMVDLHMRCGKVTRGADGGFASTEAERFDSAGGDGGNCSAYFPNTETAEARCPSGRVIVGVSGKILDDTLYNTVVLQCAALDVNGAITTDVVSQEVTGTGTTNPKPAVVPSCAPGMAVTSFKIKSACGHDQLAPRCAPIACN